ncbi:MAG: cell division protein FtsH, partial [Gemmatimonadetes bacterium]|nr:cell division protein FtsH [Pseudomonadales bacterium]NIW36730.1 cell division protein FtsH [Gemmatimonadota bacterium]NIX07712.1 cell division protein FtsH [Pseudomonadales bacterium]
MNSTLRNILFWVVLLVAIVFLWKMVNTGIGPREQEPTFTEFMDKVEATQVAKVVVRGNEVSGEYKDGAKFTTHIPEDYPDFYKTLREQGVQIKVEDASGPSWLTWGVNLLPLLLLVGFWIFIMRQMQAG